MCTRPITIKNPDPSKFLGPTLVVPCNRCPECLKSRQDSWKLRLMEESSNWSYLYFFTLTYNDDSLPVTDDGLSTACKRDVQLWLKKFRTSFMRVHDYKFKGRYFICAEYGPNGTHRPHYHGLLMTDHSFSEVSSLFDYWRVNKGFVDVSSISAVAGERQAVANYVSKYCCKGEFASRVRDINAGLIEKAWTICSKGIGASYVSRRRSFHLPFGRICDTFDEIDCVLDRMYVGFQTDKGYFKYRMPRYYRERLYQAYMPFEVDFWDKKLKKYVKKTVYRYCTKNVLSRQIQMRLRDRVLEIFYRKLRSSGFTDGPTFDVPHEVFMVLSNSTLYDLDVREHKIRRDLFSFYETQKNRWRHL